MKSRRSPAATQGAPASGGSPPGIKSYVTLDARLAWKPRENLEISVVGQNLIGDEHLERGRASTVAGRSTKSGAASMGWLL